MILAEETRIQLPRRHSERQPTVGRAGQDRKRRRLEPYVQNLRAHRPDLAKSLPVSTVLQGNTPRRAQGDIRSAHSAKGSRRALDDVPVQVMQRRSRQPTGPMALDDHLRASRKTGFYWFLELEKDSRFSIDDITVDGSTKPSSTGGVDVIIDLIRNPPGTREKLDSMRVGRMARQAASVALWLTGLLAAGHRHVRPTT